MIFFSKKNWAFRGWSMCVCYFGPPTSGSGVTTAPSSFPPATLSLCSNFVVDLTDRCGVGGRTEEKGGKGTVADFERRRKGWKYNGVAVVGRWTERGGGGQLFFLSGRKFGIPPRGTRCSRRLFAIQCAPSQKKCWWISCFGGVFDASLFGPSFFPLAKEGDGRACVL